ncbi:MAG: YggS family pyridoxal phosphate-dependent enzyme [Clostridiales bacterium]|nr:YggS family pyridoxal phosphate-dependent enzyme [Clostridiales bacterium]
MLSDNIITAKRNIELSGGYNVTIVAATKTVPAEVISSLPSYGVSIAGENRVQELLSKYDSVSGITWHFIGRLQRNKVKYIVDKVAMIHSVDSAALADEINKQCAKINKIMPVLIEVNMGGEESKGGVGEGDAIELCDYVNKLEHVKLCGIMSVLPKDAPTEMYASLYDLFVKVKGKYPSVDILSAGMSGDYEVAVRNGANLVRLGSCLFGQRIYQQKEVKVN